MSAAASRRRCDRAKPVRPKASGPLAADGIREPALDVRDVNDQHGGGQNAGQPDQPGVGALLVHDYCHSRYVPRRTYLTLMGPAEPLMFNADAKVPFTRAFLIETARP